MSAKRAILESILVMTAARCNIAPASERQVNKAKNQEGRSTGGKSWGLHRRKIDTPRRRRGGPRVVLGLVGWAAFITELRFLLQKNLQMGDNLETRYLSPELGSLTWDMKCTTSNMTTATFNAF